MNENINLLKILKDCPRGTELYCSVLGKVTFLCIDDLNSVYPIKVKVGFGTNQSKQFTKYGTYFSGVGECILFPSENQRDWKKFTAPWYKNAELKYQDQYKLVPNKFDLRTLKPFDKVLVKCTSIYNSNLVWRAELFSHFYVENNSIKVYTLGSDDNSPKLYVIPYNDDTKHLVNTDIEAPEYYRYWEE